ncbi:MAG: hypothetical protein LBF83_02735 [Spirochaetaceae bacterium]|nr:hypothetical protein [Spirochaetaceae bacterium]
MGQATIPCEEVECYEPPLPLLNKESYHYPVKFPEARNPPACLWRRLACLEGEG